MANNVAALLVVCMVVAAVDHLRKTEAEVDIFASCFDSCHKRCESEENADARCEMKCDADCVAVETTGMIPFIVMSINHASLLYMSHIIATIQALIFHFWCYGDEGKKIE